MIVFTAKNKATGNVFVGSTRESVEEYWAQLIVKAEEQGTGDILEEIRAHGADVMEVETWGYSDTPAESRELIKDACEALGAKVIKTGRTSITNSIEKKEPVALRQVNSTKDYQDIKDVMVKIEMKRKENRKSASASPVKKPSTKTGSSASINRSSTSTNQSIASATHSSVSTKAASPANKHSKVVQLATNGAKDKLPEGRVSSSAKEKRIKEAIAKERLEREAKKAAKIAAEADEMAAIMAKLDAKTKEKAKYLRRK